MNKINAIEKIWYLPKKSWSIFYPFLRLLDLPFRAIVKLKYFLYKNNLKDTIQFQKPVLVVGNISVGGTGKTPFIVQLVKQLQKENIRCGIVSRGYHAEIKSFPHQVTSNDLANQVGDEAFMLYQKLKIPLVIDPNRSGAVNCLLENNSIDLVISDDGLQHYKMSRELEVLLVDSTRMFGNQCILPLGPLREPVSRCQSVDLVVKNGIKSEGCDESINIKHSVSIVPINFINIKTRETVPLTFLKSKRVNAVAAIGNPSRFYATLASLCNVKSKNSFPDHHQFTLVDFNHLEECDGVDGNESIEPIIVMTEKDAVKCTEFAKSNWYYLNIEMVFDEPLKNVLLKKIKQVIERKING